MAVRLGDKVKQLNDADFKLLDFEDVDHIPEWVNNDEKPTYTADEVGAVDVDNEVTFTEIDNWFKAIFG